MPRAVTPRCRFWPPFPPPEGDFSKIKPALRITMAAVLATMLAAPAAADINIGVMRVIETYLGAQ